VFVMTSAVPWPFLSRWDFQEEYFKLSIYRNFAVLR